MSRSDQFPPAPSDQHVGEELPALIGGELELDAARRVTGHLRSCSECRQELVEVTAGIGLMRRLDALPPSEAADVTDTSDISDTTDVSRRPRSRVPMLLAAAAVVVLVLVGVVTAALLLTNDQPKGPRARVALTPVSDAAANGSVAMRSAGVAQAMDVDTSLGAAPRDRYYEVWLLDRITGKMLPVGVLPPDGRGTFRLPDAILKGYDTVDISLQPNDGTTQHSTDSVLRADYS